VVFYNSCSEKNSRFRTGDSSIPERLSNVRDKGNNSCRALRNQQDCSDKRRRRYKQIFRQRYSLRQISSKRNDYDDDYDTFYYNSMIKK
jgi:hypothetical protein